MNVIFYVCIPDEIQYALIHLPHAEEISPLVETGSYDEAIAIATLTEDGLRTAALWACWLGRSTLLGRLLKLEELDSDACDDAGR